MATIRGCAIRKATTAQTPTANQWNTVTFNTEDYDTDGFFNSGTSATRIVIPNLGSSIVVQLQGGIRFQSAGTGGTRGIRLIKNGGSAFGGQPNRHLAVLAATNHTLSFCTPPLIVVPGDYFELQGWSGTATPEMEASPRTFFACIVRAAQ